MLSKYKVNVTATSASILYNGSEVSAVETMTTAGKHGHLFEPCRENDF